MGFPSFTRMVSFALTGSAMSLFTLYAGAGSAGFAMKPKSGFLASTPGGMLPFIIS